MKKNKFLIKVFRNMFILGLTYSASIYASFDDFSINEFKPVWIFMILYFCSELTHHYNLSYKVGTKQPIQPLFF